MKKTIQLSLIAALFAALTLTAAAQGRPGGGPPQNAGQLVKHFADAYAKVAPYDADKDGRLNESEREKLGGDILDGRIKPPTMRRGDLSDVPHPGIIIQRVSMLYAAAREFDADKNGTLNKAEQKDLQAAIENGELRRPGGPGQRRPR